MTEGFALCPKADDPKADFVDGLVRPKVEVPNAGAPADFWPKAACPNAPPPDTAGEPKVEPVWDPPPNALEPNAGGLPAPKALWPKALPDEAPPPAGTVLNGLTLFTAPNADPPDPNDGPFPPPKADAFDLAPNGVLPGRVSLAIPEGAKICVEGTTALSEKSFGRGAPGC